MSVSSRVAPQVALRDRSGLLLLVPAATLVALAVFLVLPYYVNDLHRVPLEPVAGLVHDPKEVWPYAGGGLLAGVWWWGSFAAVMLGPLAAWIAAVVVLADLVRTRKAPRRVGQAVATLALSGAVWAWLASPLGSTLISWWFD